MQCDFISLFQFTPSLGRVRRPCRGLEKFSHRFYNVVTAAALTHKRLCTPVTACCVFFLFLEREVPAQSKLKEQPVAPGLANQVWPFKAGPPPLEAILVIFGRRALIFFFESSWKKWKMTPLLCACAVAITLETQKCRKGAPRSVEFNIFINCDRHKRFSQNERRRADL